MSAVCWSHLLPDPLRMGRLSTDDLDAIERTAECEALTMAHGISAIGELLAWTADAGELSNEPPAISAGLSTRWARYPAGSWTLRTAPSTNWSAARPPHRTRPQRAKP